MDQAKLARLQASVRIGMLMFLLSFFFNCFLIFRKREGEEILLLQFTFFALSWNCTSARLQGVEHTVQRGGIKNYNERTFGIHMMWWSCRFFPSSPLCLSQFSFCLPRFDVVWCWCYCWLLIVNAFLNRVCNDRFFFHNSIKYPCPKWPSAIANPQFSPDIRFTSFYPFTSKLTCANITEARALPAVRSRRSTRALVPMTGSYKQLSRRWTFSLSRPLRRWTCSRRMETLSTFQVRRVSFDNIYLFLPLSLSFVCSVEGKCH